MRFLNLSLSNGPRVGLLALVFLFTACAQPVKTEFDSEAAFDDYQSFAWKKPEREEVRDPADDSDILDRRMERIVNEKLTQRGYVSVPPEEADFLVTYRTTTREGAKRSGSSVSFGMGSGGMGAGVRLGGGGNQAQTVVMLDIIDARDEMLVWRGWEESQQRQDRWEAERLGRLVDRLLSEFPPQP